MHIPLVSKNQSSIRLLARIGAAGDVHSGANGEAPVPCVAQDATQPNQPNPRQVQLIHAELLQRGFKEAPGAMWENVTTRGIRTIPFVELPPPPYVPLERV